MVFVIGANMASICCFMSAVNNFLSPYLMSLGSWLCSSVDTAAGGFSMSGPLGLHCIR